MNISKNLLNLPGSQDLNVLWTLSSGLTALEPATSRAVAPPVLNPHQSGFSESLIRRCVWGGGGKWTILAILLQPERKKHIKGQKLWIQRVFYISIKRSFVIKLKLLKLTAHWLWHSVIYIFIYIFYPLLHNSGLNKSHGLLVVFNCCLFSRFFLNFLYT